MKKYIIAFLVYVIVDSAYQVIMGLKIDSFFLAQAGIKDIYYTVPKHLYLIAVFFVIIAIANVRLVVERAIEKKNVKMALKDGFLLGVVAYATFALPLVWGIKDYPLMLAVIHIVGGGFFSLCTSGITTWLLLRKKK